MAEKEAKVEKLPTPDKIAIAFQLNETTLVDGVVVRPLTFKGFAEVLNEAQNMKAPRTFDARLRRLRMARQVQYYSNGAVVPVDVEDIPKLPIPAARAIAAQLDEGEGKAGKIVRDGDGIDKSIVYQLGTPIPVGAGKEPITELEFCAKTYGEIEDVMAAPDSIQQTALLIETIAKPTTGSLLQLPSWAVNQIKIGDGVTIARLITPRFLGSPDE